MAVDPNNIANSAAGHAGIAPGQRPAVVGFPGSRAEDGIVTLGGTCTCFTLIRPCGPPSPVEPFDGLRAKGKGYGDGICCASGGYHGLTSSDHGTC